MKKTTDQMIEELAVAVQKGFTEMRQEMKSEFADVRKEMKEGFKAVDERFDQLENTVNQHDRRLDHAEDNIRLLKTKAGI